MANRLHDIVVDRIKKELEAEGEKICSPRSWIRGPAEVDIITYSEPSTMTHPLLKIIEVKDSIYDLQRALYQLLVARECLHKDKYALFYIAITQNLYEELQRLQHLDVFLKILSGSLIWSATVRTDNKMQAQSTEVSWSLGIGVAVLNEKEEKIWENRTTLTEASLMMV